MKYIELFAGIGGFRLGIEGAHPQAECVFANEWDKYAAQTYNKNFGGQIDTRDITTIPSTDIPDHDLLVGGFPCQAFSIAGKRKGFEETRGTLFFEIARILADKRPRHFILENVKGLLSHDSGQTFQTILGVCADLGYGVQWQVLNSKDFGVPQNRERVFIIGHLRGQPRPQVFPIGASDGNYINQLNQPTHSNDRVYGVEGIAPTLNTAQGGRRQPKIAYGSSQDQKVSPVDGLSPTLSASHYNQPKIAPTLRANHHNTADVHFVRGGLQKNSAEMIDQSPALTEAMGKGGGHTPVITKTVRAGGGGSPHGSKQNWDSYKIDNQIRRLTPLECERLQGFPDNWTWGVSDTQRYKQCGNAVTVPVIKAIAGRL